MEVKEPEIRKEDILILKDDQFISNHVCMVTGCGTGIGRATSVAAAANGLMTVGLDINEEEGKKTQAMARDMGGQMIFIKTDLTKDADIEHAVSEAAKMGTIKFLTNIAGIQHINSVEDFPMEKRHAACQRHISCHYGKTRTKTRHSCSGLILRDSDLRRRQSVRGRVCCISFYIGMITVIKTSMVFAVIILYSLTGIY